MLVTVLRRFCRPYRALLAAVAVAQLLSALATLALPTLNATIIDDGIARGDTATILRLGAVMLAVTAGQAVCAVVAVWCGARAALGVGRDLRAAVFGRVIGFSTRETARFGAPSLLTRSTNDVTQLQLLVALGTTMLVTAPLTMVGGVAMAWHTEPALVWLLLVGVPVLAGANVAVVASTMPVYRRMQGLVDRINAVLREQLSGVRVVRAFAREDHEQARYAAANLELTATALLAGRRQALMLPITTGVVNLSSVALVWFGGLRADAGQMQVGALVAFLSYFVQILMAVLMATLVLAMVPRASVCAGRIAEVLDTTPAVTSPARTTAPRGDARGSITVDGACFAHPGAARPVLRDVTFTASPGTVTAVVGGTGAGKSTLISLLCRLRDVTAGVVTVDGVDVREHDLEALWARMGLVPQRSRLVAGTVASNLRHGAPDTSDAQCWEALRVAAVDDVVRAHPDGLAMPIGQGGVNLSGGQRQRIALARAVVRRPAIYLLDDAFAALDVHTDARVRANLRDAARDATVVLVAQRVATVAAADQVVVLDDGAVVGVGRHDDLLRDCAVYVELVASQRAGSLIAGVHGGAR